MHIYEKMTPCIHTARWRGWSGNSDITILHDDASVAIGMVSLHSHYPPNHTHVEYDGELGYAVIVGHTPLAAISAWCDSGDVELEETPQHWHVVCFVNGCLNDADSGPLETLQAAREYLADYLQTDDAYWYYRDVDTYVSGYQILTIEPCSERECFDAPEWRWNTVF